MRNWSLIPALALLSACGIGNAQETRGDTSAGSRTFALRGFDRVAVRGSDDVIVRVGAAESVSVTGPNDVLDQLEVEVKDGELRLGRKRSGFGFNMSSPRGHAVFTVTLPRLAGATLAGSGDLQVDKVAGPKFDATIAGSGNLRVAALQSDAAAFAIAGSGDVQVAGGTRRLDISIAGAGDVDGAALTSEQAKIKIAGSGNVKAGVSRDADIAIVGSGDVEIIGPAKCSVSKLGSGEVRCAS